MKFVHVQSAFLLDNQCLAEITVMFYNARKTCQPSSHFVPPLQTLNLTSVTNLTASFFATPDISVVFCGA